MVERRNRVTLSLSFFCVQAIVALPGQGTGWEREGKDNNGGWLLETGQGSHKVASHAQWTSFPRPSFSLAVHNGVRMNQTAGKALKENHETNNRDTRAMKLVAFSTVSPWKAVVAFSLTKFFQCRLCLLHFLNSSPALQRFTTRPASFLFLKSMVVPIDIE